MGPFQVESSAQQDLTPASAKASALLVLLLLAPEMERTRSFLEKTLWSTRSDEQAKGSLRQVLVLLRRQFAIYPELLHVNRKSVKIDKNAVVCDLIDKPQIVQDKLSNGSILLEGLTVRDPVFDAWIDQLRSNPFNKELEQPDSEAHTTYNSPSIRMPVAKTRVALKLQSEGDRLEKEIGMFLADRIGLGLASNFDVGVFRFQADMNAPNDDSFLTIETVVVNQGDIRAARVTLLGSMQRILWSRSTQFPSYLNFTDADALHELIYHSIETIAQFAFRALDPSTEKKSFEALIGRALDGLFTFDGPQLLRAQEPLMQARDILPSGSVLAWSGMLSTTLFVEQVEGVDFQAVKQSAERDIEKSLEENAWDETVLGVGALTRALNGHDLVSTSDLAINALRVGRGNPVALLALAICHMRSTQMRRADMLAQRARRIAGNSRFRHWLDMFCCLTEIANGRFEHAKASALKAHRQAPFFKPPLRHLYALNLRSGHYEAAAITLKKLHVLEPHFSMSFLRAAPEYPAATLRTTGLVELTDV